jgi:alcohol dehydrogenase/propanol-preferring alcohol dehydrogenase
MKAWAVVENGAPLREVELPTPRPSGTEVLLEVTHCGVCHSDLHVWEGEWDLGGGRRMTLRERGVTLPLAMGHEVVGRVVAWGPDAHGVAEGDQRIVYPWVGCGVCAACRAEQDHMCATPSSIGIFRHGGYATHVLAAHPRHLIGFGALDPALAATHACSGITVLSAVRKVLPRAPDAPVVLVGAGGLGLNAIGILRALGHRAIVVVEVDEGRRAAAAAAGADSVVDGGGAPAEVTARIRAALGGGAEAVIDFVNGAATARAAFDALGKGGRLVQVGLFGGELAIPLPLMAMRALTISGSYVGSPGDLRDLVGLAQGGALAPLPIQLVPRADSNAALMRLRDGRVTGRQVLVAS